MTRRGFLAGAGGLTFAVAVTGTGAALVSPAAAAGKAAPIGLWVRIAPDDSITIVTPAAEMGQGSMTGVPVALAEEMDADWSRVSLEMAPTDPSRYGYGGYSMAIVGSRAMRSYFERNEMCRETSLLSYFDAVPSAPCGRCDVCLGGTNASRFKAGPDTDLERSRWERDQEAPR